MRARRKIWVLWSGLTVLMVASCATYDQGVDYASQLTPFRTPTAVTPLVASDFGVPPVFESAPLPTDLPLAPTARMEALLTWLGTRVIFDGGKAPPFPLTASTIWEASQKGHPLNCLAAATLFASVAEAAGLPARVLWLYSRDLSNENHVIVLVWLASEARWVAADPSYRTLFYDGAGRVLGPLDLRTAIAERAPVKLSPGASWNGEPVDDSYLHYLSKNLYRWSTLGSGLVRINLSPEGYGAWGPPWAPSMTVRDATTFLVGP